MMTPIPSFLRLVEVRFAMLGFEVGCFAIRSFEVCWEE